MRGFWGLMRAYWLSDRWKEAWGMTLAIAVLTAISSKMGVWWAEYSAELVNSIAYFHSPHNSAPLQHLLSAAGMLVLVTFVKDVGVVGIRHLFSSTLHRKWRGWLNGKFNEALLDDNHTHFHLQHEGRETGLSRPAPDNIDQRVQESIKQMTGGAIGLAMGVLGVVTSLYFVGAKLIETSTVVRGFEFLGVYGSAILAFAAIIAYVPVNTWIAVKLGGILERLTITIQQAEGTYRGELTTFLRRSFQVAASGGEAVQKQMHARLYKDIDSTWSKLNIFHTSYDSFERIYNFLGARIVAYTPLLLPYMQGSIGLKSYITGAELINSLIGQFSWIIRVMPEIANLKANARRITDLAEAIETVQHPAEFYRGTGRSDFQFNRRDDVFALTVRKLELLHEGESAEPFVVADELRFLPGEWTFVRGESGCGKTSFIKAVNGLWPHGAGEITIRHGLRAFYAAQDVKLPKLTLKELVCLPETQEHHSHTRVASVLHRAGLGEFIEYMDCFSREGRSWDDTLSGGQKQKLVLARILLHRPGLLFLDEATGALDPSAKIAYHQAIKDACPDITVVSVMHEAHPPRSGNGQLFYDSVIRFIDGVAVKESLDQRTGVELRLVSSHPKPLAV
ncbi:MAG: ABC transporter ATP-binding protein/permease [Rhizobiaceae bacterium]|nr:ABC transporter ATP-binding protein/permease [Rhizobiaceae bacterium]